MKAIKTKLKKELKDIERMESASSKDISNEMVDMAYKAAKTLYYICKLEKMENGGEYEVEVRENKKSML